ncbi:PucR family transcriptional regulator [Mycolicibacterium psychrotolerans]|uniref:PucR family transcriptional regulator n=1 Tax=Mycolicibacterium psychrotolerans TaxID=216929 RepID=UPI003D663CD6
MSWPLPSTRVQDLIRQGAEIALNAPQEWLDELDRATSATNPLMSEDPGLAAAGSRTNRANLLVWATANVRDPGAPVPANLGPEAIGIARDLVRRGMDQYALDGYRAGQNFAWRRWMEIAFSLTSDPAELAELLDVTAQSIAAFIDATMAGISAQMERERNDLTSGSQAERRETVTLILDGAPISRQRAEQRLGYRLTGTHTAAIVWTERPDVDARQLDRVAEAIGQVAATRPLSILASTSTRWVWVNTAVPLDLAVLRDQITPYAEAHVAVGPAADGMEGFRRSHLDALTTQRMLARLQSPQQLAAFDDVELVALLTTDPDAADAFILRTLGGLASADADLRATVATFVAEQHNASAAAESLFLHRNTLMRRIARAEQLLPKPLHDNGTHIAVALEILHWQNRTL